MRRAAFFVATVAAAALHAAAFGLVRPEGQTAALPAAGGEAVVTVIGASSDIAALVETWERAPAQAAPPPPVAPPRLAPASASAARPEPQLPRSLAPPASPAPLASPPPRVTAPEPAAAAPRAPRPRPADLPRLDPPAPTSAPADLAATGAGAGQERGEPSAARSATGKSATPHAMQAWAAQVQRALQRRLTLPHGVSQPRSRTVVLSLSLTPAGALRAASVARSSGDGAFDRAALDALRLLGKLPPAPDKLTDAVYVFEAPVVIHP